MAENDKHFGLSRREFLKLSGLSLGTIALSPLTNQLTQDFPQGQLLARNTKRGASVRALPDTSATKVGELAEDDVVAWLREVVGSNPYSASQRWVETPAGYVWSPFLQPVYNIHNQPVTTLRETSLGPGMWVETTVPWVSMVLVNDGPAGPFISRMVTEWGAPRAYYSQIWWADQIKVDDNGETWYRLNEKYSYGDIFWAPAYAFRALTPEELSPINPEAENKYIEINLHRQTLSAFENGREVFFTRVSTGRDGAETSPGYNFYPWRKMLSAHLAGSNSGAGWDLTGVGYTTYFTGSGIALHSTFWHNNYGERTSGGCVNMRPEDAKWIFLWTSPEVPYDPGDVYTEGYGFGTNIRVLEG